MAKPRQTRLDGWTLARQQVFLSTLAKCGSVTKAAETAGMSASSAYRLRCEERHATFRTAWEAAMVTAVQALRDSAMERATMGEERPLYSEGKLVGTQRVFDNRLAMFLIQMNGRQPMAHNYMKPAEDRWIHPADDFGGLLACFGPEPPVETPPPPRRDLRELKADQDKDSPAA